MRHRSIGTALVTGASSGTPNQDTELKMSVPPATTFSPAHVGVTFETRNTTRSSPMRQGSFVLAAALAVAACADGDGSRVDPVHSETGNYCVDEAQGLLQKRFGPDTRITKAQQVSSYHLWELVVTTNLCTDNFIFTSSSWEAESCTMPAYGSAPLSLSSMSAHGDCANLPAERDRP